MIWLKKLWLQLWFLLIVLSGVLLIVLILFRAGARPAEVVLSGDVARIEAMLLKNPDLVRREFRRGKVQNFTLLQIAASAGYSGAIKVLLKHGADVNQKGRLSDSALHLAVKSACHNCMKLLIDNGAHLNAPGHLGQTPLFYAIDNPTSVKLLVDAGASCKVRNDLGETVFDFARQYGRAESAQLISNACCIEVKP